MQAICKETWPNMKFLIENHYKERNRVLQEIKEEFGINIECYYIHDGKMLYMLTQHSLYSRKHQPYILCTCKRGDCNNIKNNDAKN